MQKGASQNAGELLDDDYRDVKLKLESIYNRREQIKDLEYVSSLLKKQKVLNKRIDRLISAAKIFRGKVQLKEGHIYEVDLF
ncbi:hypothetical protein THOM_0659 [Trachipleistophora hominis]|uniref:Uncharacterized protein n=1 Tax=Trachipleistophora hominis TaxID=72359 RepID=L7K003_TRAHO|nr:hypothetical protein THOM_0659 [Trachipleistophora hominis]